MSPGRAELGHTAWLGCGTAPPGGCRQNASGAAQSSAPTAPSPCRPSAPIQAMPTPPWVPTWKMARPGLGGGRRGVMARLFSLDSHSWMVTILRAGGGRWRCVRRAFFRWWKSPSVSVYLGGTTSHGAAPQPTASPRQGPQPSPPPLLLGLLALLIQCGLVEGDAACAGGAGGQEPLALCIAVTGGRQALGVLHFDSDIYGEEREGSANSPPMAAQLRLHELTAPLLAGGWDSQ